MLYLVFFLDSQPYVVGVYLFFGGMVCVLSFFSSYSFSRTVRRFSHLPVVLVVLFGSALTLSGRFSFIGGPELGGVWRSLVVLVFWVCFVILVFLLCFRMI